MITRSVQGKLLVLTVFLIGVAIGVLSDSLYQSRAVNAKPTEDLQQERLTPQERAKRDQDRLASYLGLDRTQQDQINLILDDMRAQFRQLRAKTDPQFQGIETAYRDKILAVLNEEQRRKYNEFRATHPGPGRRSARQPDHNRDEKH